MSIVDVLRSSSVFRHLSEAQFAQVVPLAKALSYPVEATVFDEGQRLGELYVVAGGLIRLETKVRVWSGESTFRSMVALLGPGGTFGWSALVEPHAATMSAVAAEPSQLVAVSGPALLNLMDKDPAAGYGVMKGIAELLAQRLNMVKMGLMSEKAMDLARHPVGI